MPKDSAALFRGLRRVWNWTKGSVARARRTFKGTKDQMDDIGGLRSTVRYEIVGRFEVPVEADLLHEQGRQADGSGDYRTAITLLERASSLAPQWPYPVYDMAFCYLLLNDSENARKHYRRTVELAPRGFFTAIIALDTLDREEKGDLPVGTYLAYLSLEGMDDPGQRAEIVRQLVERIPAFAPGWKELADVSDDDAEKLTAIERGLIANPDAETKGTLKVNKALILNRKGDHEGAVQLLSELTLDPASTLLTEHVARVVLTHLGKD